MYRANYNQNYGMNGDVVLGYVLTYKNILLGFSGGFTYLNAIAKTVTSGVFAGSDFNEQDSIKLNHFYELLFQGGYLLRDSTQIYAVVGAAAGQFHFTQGYKFTTQTVTTSTNNAKSLWGIDAGVGIKEQLSDKWAVNLAVQSITFQSTSYSEVHNNPLDTIQYSPSLLFGKIGVEYRFDTPQKFDVSQK